MLAFARDLAIHTGKFVKQAQMQAQDNGTLSFLTLALALALRHFTRKCICACSTCVNQSLESREGGFVTRGMVDGGVHEDGHPLWLINIFYVEFRGNISYKPP